MKKLKHTDFKAAAALGWFVYVYLRIKDWSPYYVGIASDPYRPIGKHTCIVPKDRSRIRIMRSCLTEEEAKEWEVFYIAHFGRKDLGTGILRNMTDGGEGRTGGPDMIRKAKEYGFEFEEWKSFSPIRRAAISARWAVGERGETLRTRYNLMDFKTAQKLGISVERLLELTHEERALAHQRHSRSGVRGEALFASPAEPMQRGVISGDVRADAAAEKYGVTREEYDSWSQQWKCVVATRYQEGHRGALLLGEENRNDTRLEAAAEAIGLTPDQMRAMSRKERNRIKARFKAGVRGEALLAEKDTSRSPEAAADRLDYTLEEWNELTPRQKRQATENYRQAKIYAEQWGVEQRLVRLMTDSQRASFMPKVRTALSKGVCPLLWGLASSKVRSRVGARYSRGVRGLELMDGC